MLLAKFYGNLSGDFRIDKNMLSKMLSAAPFLWFFGGRQRTMKVRVFSRWTVGRYLTRDSKQRNLWMRSGATH